MFVRKFYDIELGGGSVLPYQESEIISDIVKKNKELIAENTKLKLKTVMLLAIINFLLVASVLLFAMFIVK